MLKPTQKKTVVRIQKMMQAPGRYVSDGAFSFSYKLLA
jgi:hypothetical protein